jgi:hypothetical protein
MRKIVIIALVSVLALSGLTPASSADSLVVSKTTPYKANIAGVGDIWKGDIPTSIEFPLSSSYQKIEFPIQGILPYSVLADRATGTDVEFELWSTVGKKISYDTVYSFDWNPVGPNTLVSMSVTESEAIGSHVLIIRTIYETKTNGLLTSYLKQETQLPVTIVGKKKSQSITAGKLTERKLSEGYFNLYSSDFRSSEYSLTVDVTSATPAVCSVSGTQVKLLTIGTCTLTGSQPGNTSIEKATSVSTSFNVLGNKPMAITGMSAAREQLEISYTFKKPLSDYPIQKYEVMIQTLTGSNLAPNAYASYGPYTLLKTVNSEDFKVTLAEIKSYLQESKVLDITNTSVMIRVRAVSEGGNAEWGDGIYSETKNFGWLTPAQEKAAAELKAKQEADAKATADALIALQYSNKDRCETLNKSIEDLKTLISNYQSKYPSNSEFARLMGQLPNSLNCDNFQDKTFSTLVSSLDFNLSVIDSSLTSTMKAADTKPVTTKKTTITCVKGKLTKKVTAINPKCPAGYKKK